MKPYVPEFNSKEEILTTTPLWIKLPNLPLNCWNPKVLSKMGSSLEKPQYADECTTQVNRISLTRILVEVDITKSLPKVIKIHVPKGRVSEQQIWFEWKPTFCKKFLQVQKKIQGQGQKKEWIPIIVIGKEQANEMGQVLPQDEEVTDQPEIDVAWVTGASQVQDAKTRDFQECLIDYNLAELHIGGREYTLNEHVYGRIDKVLVNDAWMEKISVQQVMAMDQFQKNKSWLWHIHYSQTFLHSV
ncbi:hypothetical protein H5410_003184 [Solanum commersonii]|uniref:DUF4283 domain-containing protein n=1 Tax=Solanum commersonii TaxID=4109 RepID=A0A9J6B4C1_SOLCO|nr:hypothetical protein H5410_003184 [Solanum commersonii]